MFMYVVVCVGANKSMCFTNVCLYMLLRKSVYACGGCVCVCVCTCVRVYVSVCVFVCLRETQWMRGHKLTDPHGHPAPCSSRVPSVSPRGSVGGVFLGL